jgi:hypothetical protein
MTKRIGIVAVFLVGCAVGGGASQFVVPKASAQQAATLTKWEIVCEQGLNWDEFQPVARKMGDQGFELVGYSYADQSSCFKRPKM